MATLKQYVIEVGGVEHTVQLDPDDAKRAGAQLIAAKAESKVVTK